MATSFADILVPPPPPAGGFADVLAGAFGAGPNRAKAYATGLDTSSQYRLRSAQTDSALAEAEKRRGDALRTSMQNDIVSKAMADPNYGGSFADSIAFATGANDYSNARLGDQEFGNRRLLADPGTAPDVAFAAGQGVQGKVLPRLDTVSGETTNLAVDPNTTFRTPAQQQSMEADAALETQRLRPGSGSTNIYTQLTPDQVAAAGYAPGTVVHTDARGKPMVTQRPPAAPKIPAKVKQGMSENDALLKSIDSAIAITRANPGAFGLKYGLGDEVNQRMDPNGIAARAAVANIGSAKIHERTGATMAAKEYPRLTPFVPAITNTSDAIITKLEQMRAALIEEQDAITSAYETPAAPPPGGAPAGGAPMSFATEAEAEAAGLEPGTRVVIGGVAGTWE